MRKLISTLVGAVTVMVAALASAGTAQAYVTWPNTSGWSSPAEMPPTGTLCLRTGGSTFIGPPIVAAAAGWNKSDLTVVASATCAGYPRNRTLAFAAYYDYRKTATGYTVACAVYSAGVYDWVAVRGKMVWVARTPTVKMNYAPLAMKQCHATAKARTTTISHEAGHWLGLGHATGITVMTSRQSSYSVATYYDIVRVNGRY